MNQLTLVLILLAQLVNAIKISLSSSPPRRHTVSPSLLTSNHPHTNKKATKTIDAAFKSAFFARPHATNVKRATKKYPLGLKRLNYNATLNAHNAKKLVQQHLDSGISTQDVIPSAYDLSNVNGLNFMTRIKDQGKCGSCVAFATMSCMESTMLKAVGSPGTSMANTYNPDLSEEGLYFCDSNSQCNDGMVVQYAAAWAVGTGAAGQYSGYTESCLPYHDSDRLKSCSLLCQQRYDSYAEGTWQWTSLRTIADIQNHMIQHGPVVAAFEVFSDFYDYSGGVWTGTSTNNDQGGHAVSCYGWETHPQYGLVWLCKNSWNTDWGVQGTFRIKSGVDQFMGDNPPAVGFKFVGGTPVTTSAARSASPTTTQPPPPPPPPPVFTTQDPVTTTTEILTTTTETVTYTPADDWCAYNNGGCDPSVTCQVSQQDPNLVICGPCPDGFTGNGVDGCVPPDPSSNPCSSDTTCDPNNGVCNWDITTNSVQCSCQLGYILQDDGTTCLDACQVGGTCDITNTGAGTCTNNFDGTVDCGCDASMGYLPDPTVPDNSVCLDACLVNKGGCDKSHGKCKNNYDGTILCTCLTGWTLATRGSTTCTDICSTRSNPCLAPAICGHKSALDGTVVCTCPTGWNLTTNKRSCNPPSMFKNTKVIRSCSDNKYYLRVKALANGKIQCLGPNSSKCSMYLDAYTTKLAPGSSAPAFNQGHVCTAAELKKGWCLEANRQVKQGRPQSVC